MTDVYRVLNFGAGVQSTAAARGWACAKYGDDGVITLQHCPEFDRVQEPAVGVCITVTPRGEVSERLPNEDPLIWHHKWMWVRDSYRGFDVAASVARSLQWADIVPAKLKSVIGQRSVWREVCRELRLKL